jgi:hypothetical protein
VDERLLKRQEQRKRKLKEAGIDYDFGMVAYVRCHSFAISARRHINLLLEKETTDE